MYNYLMFLLITLTTWTDLSSGLVMAAALFPKDSPPHMTKYAYVVTRISIISWLLLVQVSSGSPQLTPQTRAGQAL